MRSLFASAVLAWAVLFAAFTAAPSVKTLFDYCVTAASAIAVFRFVAGKLPVVCWCPHCTESTFRVRFHDVGTRVPCPDCLEHELHVPRLTLSQVVWQNVQIAAFGADLEDVAFDCPIFPK